MTTKKEQERKIDPARWYTLTDIVKEGLFPWCDNIATVRKWVLADKNTKNKLKVVIVGEGKARKYHMRGENIISFLVNVEDGSYHN